MSNATITITSVVPNPIKHLYLPLHSLAQENKPFFEINNLLLRAQGRIEACGYRRKNNGPLRKIVFQIYFCT